MHDKTVAQLTAGLQTGQFSSAELTRCFLDRIASLDSRYNSFISVADEQAMAAARAADEAVDQLLGNRLLLRRRAALEHLDPDDGHACRSPL